MRHTSEEHTLREIVNLMDSRAVEPWYDTMGITIDGIDELRAKWRTARDANDTDLMDELIDQIDDLEHAYLDAHRDDVIRVSWPDHVIIPRYNSDANYSNPIAKENSRAKTYGDRGLTAISNSVDSLLDAIGINAEVRSC